jgi:hypothetical protein
MQYVMSYGRVSGNDDDDDYDGTYILQFMNETHVLS